MVELENILGKENVKYNEPMSKHTSFRVGGNADIFAIVDSEENLTKVIKLAKKSSMPITIVGNGTNLLVKDGGIRGLVIKYIANDYSFINKEEPKDKDNNIDESNEDATNSKIITVSSGMTNARLAKILLDNSLSGFEFLAGVPGTIGGALVMNAGAFGGEIKDIVLNTKYIDLDNIEERIIEKNEHKFEYRKSIFQSLNCIILETTLKLKLESKDKIEEKMNEYSKKRIETQPLDMPSAGSTFKRGNDFITAKLIDESGLKGYSIGGAEVSTKHAGFIVNKGNAKAKDIIELINYVKEKVYEKFGKEIQEEVKIIGED